TRATVYSRYYLGSIAFVRGNYDLAVSQFQAGIAIRKETGVMKYLLRQGIASSLEAKGDFAGAVAAYRDAATFADGDMKTQSRLGEARILALTGKNTEAAALYRLILKESPETPLRDLVEIRLAQTS
ncbi:MAG TPA: tetratricopeptide repeat protein, partial [Candidatus Methylomirabilis sp.]|nr:tetratricopeptide repeat protein [Candidatus Methylomirabilis sp.]